MGPWAHAERDEAPGTGARAAVLFGWPSRVVAVPRADQSRQFRLPDRLLGHRQIEDGTETALVVDCRRNRPHHFVRHQVQRHFPWSRRPDLARQPATDHAGRPRHAVRSIFGLCLAAAGAEPHGLPYLEGYSFKDRLLYSGRVLLDFDLYNWLGIETSRAP